MMVVFVSHRNQRYVFLHCVNFVCLLFRAGMSVASGIPDFRSSNGLYATLEATKLTATPEQIERIQSDPSYSLDQHLFMENPLPCLEVNREFILGVRERRWKATLAHRFVECLRTKVKNKEGEGKLVRLYTQNIDGLEDQCEGIGHERRIAVHGSMDEAECATCGARMDFDLFCGMVKSQIKDITGRDPSAPAHSTPIVCESCGAATVKPSIVLFRSRLPEVFFDNVPNDVKDIDLLLILGTSLAVAPANSLVMRIPRSSMRVLMNREPVGWHLGLDYDSNDRDYFAQGNCENLALDFMESLGWLEDLKPLLDQGEFPESSATLLRERLEQIKQQKLEGQEQKQIQSEIQPQDQPQASTSELNGHEQNQIQPEIQPQDQSQASTPELNGHEQNQIQPEIQPQDQPKASTLELNGQAQNQFQSEIQPQDQPQASTPENRS